MRYLNNYKSWKKINEELNDSTVLSAANKHESDGKPDKAHEIRVKVEPNYQDRFRFYFFPISINGDVATFRAYLENKEDAIKVSRILKVFNNLSGLPQVNKLWIEMNKVKASSGLVSLYYEYPNNYGTKFVFKPSGINVK